MRTRADKERLEAETLAPFAQRSGESRGRKHPEPSHPNRTQYERDRARIIHSRAFRRLEYKTQVFLNGTGDHLRTRLTHSMEVAAIARNISRALRLNEDLTETIALAHDLGHSPFGHKGEAGLNKLMRKHGGFEHNRQSLRVVEFLEEKYPRFSGLNLSWEVREGLAKHGTPFDGSVASRRLKFRQPSLEAQVANIADEITYYSHDLDDGLTARLFTEKRLNRDVTIWRQAAQTVRQEYGKLPDESRRYFIIRCIIDCQVKDVVFTTEEAILAAKISSADEARSHKTPLVQYSPERRKLNMELRRYLYKNMYFAAEVYEPNRRAVRMLEDLFHYYTKNREQLLPLLGKRAKMDGWPRAICDYLAGMTDRFAIQEHQRVFGLQV